LIVRLKQSARKLVAGAAVMTVILAALPGVVEAQDTTNVPAQGNIDNLSVTNTTSQPASETPMDAVVTVKAGDSLWSISQESLGFEAPPAQIAEEVERISEANWGLPGGEQILILPGQQLLVPEVPEPATSEPTPLETVTEEPVPSDPTTSESVANEPVANEPVASEPAVAPSALSVKPPLGMTERQMLGWGIIALTLILTFLMTWKRPMRRDAKGKEWEMLVGYSDRLDTLPTLSPEGNSNEYRDNAPSNGHSFERVGVDAGLGGATRKGIRRRKKQIPRRVKPSRGWAVGAHDPQVRSFLRRVPRQMARRPVGKMARRPVVMKG
jgi:LysM repeat protein